MTSIWVRLMKKNRIERQTTVVCVGDDALDRLTDACRELDVPRPIFFEKNTREWNEFHLTSFTDGNFMEPIHFDKMELELVDTERKKPDNARRNPLWDA